MSTQLLVATATVVALNLAAPYEAKVPMVGKYAGVVELAAGAALVWMVKPENEIARGASYGLFISGAVKTIALLAAMWSK